MNKINLEIEKFQKKFQKKFPKLNFEDDFFLSYIDYKKSIINKIEIQVNEYEKSLFLSHGVIKSELEYDYIKLSNSYEKYINKKYSYLYFLKKYVKKRIYNNLLTLVNDLNKDLDELLEKNLIKSSKILTIDFGMGDFHSELKSTCIITFNDNEKIVYKPRKINTELFFTEFLKIVEETCQVNLNLKIPRFLFKGRYSWHEFIFYKSDKSNEDTYCKNIGYLLGIGYLLNSRDLIYDNLIFHNDFIYIIDIECIVSPNIESRFAIRNKIEMEYDTSVIASGILPMRYGTLNKNESISAIFKVPNDNNLHLPTIQGEIFEIDENHIDLISNYFHELLMLIIKQKNYIILKTESLKTLNINLRLLFHTTDLYTTLGNEMLIPEYLSQINDFRVMIENSFPNESNKFKKSVQIQLELLDIPFFYSNSKGEIYDGLNKKIRKKKLFSFECCLTEVLKKIKYLDENKITFNKSLIKKTILVELDNRNKLKYERQNFIEFNINNHSCNQINKQNLLRASEIIGEYLINHIETVQKDINWITKTLRSDGSYTIKPLSSDLYDGNIGIEVFFHFLSKISENIVFSEISNKLYRQNLVFFYKFIQATKKNRDEISLTMFNFPLSFLYTTIIKFDSNFFEDNKNIIITIFDLIDEVIEKTSEVDYVQGISSLLDKLLDLYSAGKLDIETSDRLNATMLNIIDKIINSAYEFDDGLAWNFQMNIGGISHNNFLNGFSHGVSGIIFVLKKASFLLELKSLDLIIKKALNFEKKLFDKQNNSWFDNRLNQKTTDIGAWCHGSGGIALSKLLFLNFEKLIDIENDLKIACKNILPTEFLNLSLCHGSLSNIEILNAADRYFKENTYQSMINSYISQVANQILNGKLPKVSETGLINLTGMFIGITGVGYQLLRFYDWENIPSIICLETDFYKYKTLH